MRKIILVLALALVGITANAQSKIGTIDADYIVAQMPEMTEVNKGLEVYGEELQKDLESSITSYEAAVKAYQENLDSLSEEEKQTKEGEIIALENEIKGFRQKASVMIQMKRNELTQPLYEKINTAMLAIVEAEGFTQILHSGSNALAYSAEGSDITLKVLSKLGITVAAVSE